MFISVVSLLIYILFVVVTSKLDNVGKDKLSESKEHLDVKVRIAHQNILNQPTK